jgi:precorrin-2 dehydrogenase/sirohydrochlorin ferrochelatase
MGLTSLFLEVKDKNVFILGTGEVATRRANRFLDKGANVILGGNSISQELLDKGAFLKSLEDVERWVDWSDIVIIASGDEELSDYVAKISEGKLLNRADKPNEGNLIVPTSFIIGDVEVSLYTGGKSPLMAKELRKKIQSTITQEDIFEIEIQDYCRSLLKSKISNQKDRKIKLYEILNDGVVNNLLCDGKIDEAKSYVKDCIDKI